MTDQEAYSLTERLISSYFPAQFEDEIHKCYLDTWKITTQVLNEDSDVESYFANRICDCMSEISVAIICAVDIYIQDNFPSKPKQMKDYATNWYMALLDVERNGFVSFAVLYRLIYLALTDKIAEEQRSTPFINWMEAQFGELLKAYNNPQEESSIYCFSCGEKNRSDANFCKKCGAKLS